MAPRTLALGNVAGLVFALGLATHGVASAQSVYKYRGDDGQWIYTDRPPADGRKVEVRAGASRKLAAGVSVTHELVGNSIVITASNGMYAPVEIGLKFDAIEGVDYPDPDKDKRWLVAPRSESQLLRLNVRETVSPPHVSYRFAYVPGVPNATHRVRDGYRAPFAAGKYYPVTQAYPDNITHQSPDSKYAIDIAMPIGTDVLAARGGVVFDMKSTNFRNGFIASEHARYANYVSILHDDGTMGVYAHLNWNTVRVSPGQRVAAGQYIADSGNTGYSSGPHLHFVVQRNAGMKLESVPVEFRGMGATTVAPATGTRVTES